MEIRTDSVPATVTPADLCEGRVQISICHRDGRRRDFLIRNVEDSRGLTRFADVKVGSRYEYMGTFNPEAIHPEEVLHLTPGSKFADSDLAVQSFRRFVCQLLYFGEIRENKFYGIVQRVA